MDDHSQPEFRSGPGGECCAAECASRERSDTEHVAQPLTRPATQRPFVWQRGRRLLLLEWELGCWVLAELEFDPRFCRYTELRRAFYEWEREAAGALLSRTIAYGERDAAEAAELLDVWIRHRR